MRLPDELYICDAQLTQISGRGFRSGFCHVRIRELTVSDGRCAIWQRLPEGRAT
jgi:hypothetical protein